MLPKQLYETEALGVDLETTGLSWVKGDMPFAISFTTKEGFDYYIRWEVDPFTRRVLYDGWVEEVRHLLEASKFLVFHNASFDIPMGVKFLGWDLSFLDKTTDTLILAHSANSSRPSYRLKPLTKELLGFPDDDQAELQNATKTARKMGRKLGWKLADDVEADYWMAPPEFCEKYAVRDTQRTMKLYKLLIPLLEAKEAPYDHFRELVTLEHQVLRSTVKMNLKGVRIDPLKIEELREYYGGIIEAGEAKLKEMGFGEFNYDSSKQKMGVFKSLGFEPEERRRKKKDGTTTKTESFDKKVLEKISEKSPLAETLLELGEASHQLGSFVEPFSELAVREPEGLILYPNFGSVGPKTGRWSCKNPNLQNVTSESSPLRKSSVEFKVRSCFIPREGYVWMLADYSQIEVWRAAYASMDKTMLGVLESGASLHDLTCDRLFSSKPDFSINRPKYRKLAKIVSFSILYGSGPKALVALLNCDLGEAKRIYETFWDTYPGLRDYSKRLERLVKRQGWVQDAFGRVYFLPQNWGYKALNYIIQGSAGGVLKRAFVNVDNLLRSQFPSSHLVMCVHDELILDVKKEHLSHKFVSQVVKAMQGNFHELFGMKKPFDIEVSFTDKNWLEKVKYENPDKNLV